MAVASSAGVHAAHSQTIWSGTLGCIEAQKGTKKGGETTAGSDQILHILHGDKEHGANPAQAPIPYWGAGPAFCCGTKQLVGGFF